MKIGRKLAIGYTVIVALIGGIVYTYLREWRQMVSLESEIKQIHEVWKSRSRLTPEGTVSLTPRNLFRLTPHKSWPTGSFLFCPTSFWH